MNEQAKKETKRTRRWLKVSLRTFLLAITVLCVWLGFIVNRVNKQKQAVAWVRENGGAVLYDFQYDEDTQQPTRDAPPPGPYWLRERIGIDYFADVEYVNFIAAKNLNDLSRLAGMKRLKFLSLYKTQVSDLSPLANLKDLQELNLNYTQVSDLSPLAGLKSMEFLNLTNTRVSDLSPLVGMKHLRYLFIGKTQVSDLSPLSEMSELQLLSIGHTDVSDLSPLVGTKKLYIYADEYQQLNVPPNLESRVNRSPLFFE